MLTAVDSKGNKVFIDNVKPEDVFFCPVCEQKLIQKRKGLMRRPHFAHFGKKDPHFTPCPDRWGNDISEWHTNWQEQFPVDNIEVVVNYNGIKHRADVLIANTVIEFQHSGISYEEFTERNEFYLAAGYDVVWVFDLQKEYAGQQIHKEIYEGEDYVWSHVKRPFKQMRLDDSRVRLFLQFVTPDNSEIPILEYLSSANQGFTRFCTDEKNVLSTKEFISLVSDKMLSVVFEQYAVTNNLEEFECSQEDTKESNLNEDKDNTGEIDSIHEQQNTSAHYPEKPNLPPDPNGKTIRQLWKTDYQFMVVRNSTNMEEMVIHGKDGKMSTNYWGKIEGSYSNRNWDGSYWYSKKRYPVKDADSPIWLLRYSREREEVVLERETPPIPGAKSLMDLMRDNTTDQLIVQCLANGKAYYLNSIDISWGYQFRFNSTEIDLESGELLTKNGNQNGFVYPRRNVQIWKSV